MPKLLLRGLRSNQHLLLYLAIALVIFILAWYSWLWGLICFLLMSCLIYYVYREEKAVETQIEQYIATLSYRIKKVGEDVLSGLPMGIILYNEENKIEWHNKYLTELIEGEDSFIGLTLNDLLPKLEEWLAEEEEEGLLRFQELIFKVHSNPEERLLYIYDQTDFQLLQQKYRQEKNVFLHIHVDNLDEVTQGVDEQLRTLLASEVTKALNEWSQEMGIYIRRTSSEKFFGITDEKVLRQLEENRFDILDKVRALSSKNRIPVTLSIGVGAGSENLLELGQLAQSSLDIALGRGGDQAAVKRVSGKITFYGGKSNAVEKRTRVRARVIAHALQDIIKGSDQVFIMGHRDPDLDSIGSAIGVLKMVQANGKTGHILLNREQVTYGIDKLLAEIEQDSKLLERFMVPSTALEIATENSLLFIVDTHKPALLMEPKLLESVSRRVVIDHHRRGEDFIPDPLLVYIEPYASSTSELVTELLEYQSKEVEMNRLEASALLAGIVVDTKSFAFRTGSRTFDAASYLRQQGADTSLIQKLLKEDLDQFVRRSKIVESAKIYYDKYAVAITQADEQYGQVLLAQAADTLLSMNQVLASFVIGEWGEGFITISARSLGDLNVQVIMEQMKGGGHLTNAATQLTGLSTDEALQWLLQVVADYHEGGEDK